MRILIVVALLALAGCRRTPCTNCAVEPRTQGEPGVCGDVAEVATPVVPARQPPPLLGGSLTALPDGTFVVADADRAVVWHVDTHSVLGSWALEPDDLPGRVLAANDQVFVVLRRAGQIAQLDPATHTLSRHDTCVEPRSLVQFGGELLVGCSGGTVETLDRTREVARSEVLFDLRDLSVIDGKLIASTFRNAQLIEVSSTPRLLFQRAAANGFAPHVAWRLRQNLVVAQEDMSTPLGPVAICPPYYGRRTEFTNLVGVVVSTLYRVGDRIEPIARVPAAVVPVDVAEKDGAVFIASAGTNSVVRVDATTGMTVEWPVDGQPTSLEVRGENLVVFLREPARLVFFSLSGELRGSVTLGGASVASSGHELFHRATGQGIACASCHPEAGDDGHVWQFAEGARRTPTLRGGLSGTAPFHWSGDQVTLDELMSNVMVMRMGGGKQTPERVASLLTWLDEQPGQRAPAVDAEASLRGKQLFDSAEVGCASCHAGAQGTNNDNADVGTGGSFQVPRLAEAYWRGSLFHDGRVRNLASRFTGAANNDGHGRTAQLTDSQRADLLEYVKTR